MSLETPVPATDLLGLANNVHNQTRRLIEYLEATNSPAPTFETDSPQLPNDGECLTLRNSLISTLEDLKRLVEGPNQYLRSFICQGNDLAAFQVAFEFELFSLVPLDGGMSVVDIAKHAGVDVDRMSRILRMMATHRVFQETKPGWFSHTSTSALLHGDEELRCSGHYMLDEMWRAANATAATLKDSPDISDNEHCPFTKGNGAPMFKYYSQNPKLATRFAKAMAGVTRVDRQIQELRDGYQWSQLDGTVVDVGGGSGHVSMALAQVYPNLNFVIQDVSTDMLAEGKRLATPDIAERISFMQYDFFKPQPMRDVSAFFIRQCVHNWCDSKVVEILKALVPGLEGSQPGTPLLINDTVLPEPGATLLNEERGLRQMDMLMLIALGSKQRTRAEFETLLEEADSRYEIRNVHSAGSMGLLEVHLRHGV